MKNFSTFILIIILFSLDLLAMEKKPFHHLPDGTFRNPEGSPERDSIVKWSYKIFNEERKKIKIEMGEPTFDWKKIPLSKNIDHKKISLKIDDNELKDGFALNVGNPHIIFFVEDCFKYDLKKIGPLVENNDLFPEKINLTFAQVKDSSNILVNVWERGAGLTKACGTAACATGVAAFEKKLTDNKINIHFKEGFLNIEYNKLISMTGPVSDIKEIIIKL